VLLTVDTVLNAAGDDDDDERNPFAALPTDDSTLNSISSLVLVVSQL